jgi:ribonuclease HII
MVNNLKRDVPPQNKKTSLNRSEEIKAAGTKTIVIGIDEAGRGPLCGPVVAAACIVSDTDGQDIDGIIDSKKLTSEKDREEVYENLVSDQRVMWCTSIVSNTEIDSINILQASLAAMKRATEGLISKYNLKNLSSCIALIDGNKIPEEMPIFSKYIIKVNKLSLLTYYVRIHIRIYRYVCLCL